MTALRRFEELRDGTRDRSTEYRETLSARPWEACPCGICAKVAVQVVFRGAERNRRRGFHNLWVLHQRLHRELAGLQPES